MGQISRPIVVSSLAMVTATLLAFEGELANEPETPIPVPASRSSVELGTNWRFQIDVPDVGQKENWQATTFDRSKWTRVEVPKAWDLFDDAMWNYEGVGWYATEIPGELAIKGKMQRLKFGRVNYHAKVWLNGQFLGFVLMEEVPINWWGNDFSGKGDEVLDESILDQALPALEGMIQRDKNHPCVIIWSMANESQTAKPAGIAVMRKLIRRAKELDPTRLVTFVISTQDAWLHAAYEEADLVGINVYMSVFGPDISLHARDLGERVTRPGAEYIRRQLAAFPNKPVLVTEYGTRGVPGLHGDIAYTEDHQAALNEAAWRVIQDCAECSGGILWCWADYYHRRTFNDNGPFGCFGVVTVDRRPKAALTALARMYGGKLDDTHDSAHSGSGKE